MAITGHSQAEPRIMGKENEVTLYKRTSISDALGGVNSPGVSSMEIKELKLPITYVSGLLQGSASVTDKCVGNLDQKYTLHLGFSNWIF